MKLELSQEINHVLASDDAFLTKSYIDIEINNLSVLRSG
jgi:hypothetical protein